MPRACTVCAHPEREAIDQALVSGESPVSLSARYCTIGRMALTRHKEKHLAAALVKAQEAQEAASGGDLLSQVRSLQAKSLAILARAEAAGDLRTALFAIGQARGCLELLGKIMAEIARTRLGSADAPEVRVREIIVELPGRDRDRPESEKEMATCEAGGSAPSTATGPEATGRRADPALPMDSALADFLRS